MKRLQSFIKDRIQRSGEERGNLLIFYVMLIPVFIALLAIAVDTQAAFSTRDNIQSAVDASTQGTLALSKNRTDGNQPSLTQEEARNAFVNLYDMNRAGTNTNGRKIPFIVCQTSNNAVELRGLEIPASNCGFTVSRFSYSPATRVGASHTGSYLTVTIQERVSTIFLHTLGTRFDDLTHTVSSSSRLTNSWE